MKHYEKWRKNKNYLGSSETICETSNKNIWWFIGLQEGDVIVEVNGESTYDLHVDDFIQMTTGQAGTQADFRLYGDSEDDLPHIFTRAPLDL